jgi:DNA-directed RNA polymerase
MSAEEKVEVLVERAKFTKHKKEMHSLWCTELYRLSIANKFRNEVFWFPHNIDFRGRAYACPPHFSHIGGDLARSILLFAQGKPLGPTGLDWLKIHVVNLTGLRKRSPNAERLAFANEILPLILDSADKPLTVSSIIAWYCVQVVDMCRYVACMCYV